jgi:murein DD-endopeptidase MepM/ murein hydrolase activator NlpD
MKKSSWSFLLITTNSLSRVRNVTLSSITIAFILLFSVIGFVGLFRMVWITSSFYLAKWGVYEARRENESLTSKVTFLNKFVEKETAKINELTFFEDKIRLQYGLQRISKDVRMAGIGGGPGRDDLIYASLLDPVLLSAVKVSQIIETLIRQAKIQDSTLSRMAAQVDSIHQIWASRPLIRPVNGGSITSGYGYRMHPIVGENMFHEGLDIGGKLNTPIHATADGYIESAGPRDYYGNAIFIKHKNGHCETVYAHLNKIAVKKGQYVKRGDVIGFMGNSGRSTGIHLHYEIRINGKHVNPLSYILTNDDEEKIID